MPNFNRSNSYNKVGYRPLPVTFDTDFINHINHGLFDDEAEPVQFFAELHRQYDVLIGSSEVSRHILHAIHGTELESKYGYQ